MENESRGVNSNGRRGEDGNRGEGGVGGWDMSHLIRPKCFFY